MIKAALALARSDRLRKNISISALAWQAAFDRHYANDNNGGYYLTADDAEGLVVRPDSTLDDATPNPNGIAAQNLIRLAVFTGDDSFRAKADTLIAGVLSEGAENLFARISMLNAVDLRIGGAEIVIAGADDGSLTQAALKLAVRQPHRVARAVGGCAVAVASGAGENPRHRRSRGLHLRRADLLAAGHDRGRDRESVRGVAPAGVTRFSRFENPRRNFVHCASRRQKSRARHVQLPR